MRTKIIGVYALIMVIVGVLAFAVVRQMVQSASANTVTLAAHAKQDAESVAARLQLDALKIERWIGVKAQEPASHEVVARATAEARGDAATSLCNEILNQAKSAPGIGGVPSLALVVDGSAKIVGRSGSSLSRGEDLGTLYPALKIAAQKGVSGSDVWMNPSRGDQHVVSYAAIRDAAGKSVGVLVIGVTITDQLSKLAELASGKGLAVAFGDESKGMINGPQTSDEAKSVLTSAAAQARAAIQSGQLARAEISGLQVAAVPLESFGDGKRAALLAVGAPALIEGASTISLSILGVMALGLLMVVAAGWMLGSYITKPIGVLEEGLLAIINGQDDKRFNLEHPDLGGLAFRIDQLLNKLMGVEEDTTDSEGRVSIGSVHPPPAFSDVMSDDPSGDPAFVQKLAAEPSDAYYGRLYREYIAAKKSLGEATDHITNEAFITRIQSMEKDATQKHGRPVRYYVKANTKEVVLLAIPLEPGATS